MQALLGLGDIFIPKLYVRTVAVASPIEVEAITINTHHGKLTTFTEK
jgi:hypothetical protein